MEQDLSETETEELIAKIDDEFVMTTIDDENFEISSMLSLNMTGKSYWITFLTKCMLLWNHDKLS